MKWSDLPLQPTTRMLRQFAGAWLVFFLALAVFQAFLRHREVLGFGLASAGVLIGGLGLIFPRAIRGLFIGATVAAFPIGWLISQIMLALMFYGLITPVALFFRLRGRDPLHRRSEPNRSSFWTPKGTPDDIRRYLRQY